MNSQPKDQAPKVRAEENSFSTGPKVFDKLQLLAEVARNMDPRYANQQTDAKKTRNIQVNKEIKTIASSTIMKGEKAPTNGNVKSLRDAVTFLKTMELTSSNFLLPGMKEETSVKDVASSTTLPSPEGVKIDEPTEVQEKLVIDQTPPPSKRGRKGKRKNKRNPRLSGPNSLGWGASVSPILEGATAGGDDEFIPPNSNAGNVQNFKQDLKGSVKIPQNFDSHTGKRFGEKGTNSRDNDVEKASNHKEKVESLGYISGKSQQNNERFGRLDNRRITRQSLTKQKDNNIIEFGSSAGEISPGEAKIQAENNNQKEDEDNNSPKRPKPTEERENSFVPKRGRGRGRGRGRKRAYFRNPSGRKPGRVAEIRGNEGNIIGQSPNEADEFIREVSANPVSEKEEITPLAMEEEGGEEQGGEWKVEAQDTTAPQQKAEVQLQYGFVGTRPILRNFEGIFAVEGDPSAEGSMRSKLTGAVGVQNWLESFGLGKYHEILVRNEVDDTVLPHLTMEDLKEMGITAVGARRKLFMAISELGKKVLSSPPGP